jgi:excisionase family DNA binding protein
MTTATIEQTYGVPEFAKTVGISKPHAYRLVERGEVPSIKLGRRILIPGWYVAKLLSEPMTQAAGE